LYEELFKGNGKSLSVVSAEESKISISAVQPRKFAIIDLKMMETPNLEACRQKGL
jgi:hypothetical protein